MKKKTTKQNKTEKPNWHRIITLSAAAQYIQVSLDKELKKIKQK